jgi:hypothetical protein
MDSKNKKGLITVLVVVGVAIVAYKMFGKKKEVQDKGWYARNIIQRGYYTSGITNLMTFNEDYLKAWSDAATQNLPVFIYDGKNHSTQGGKIAK